MINLHDLVHLYRNIMGKLLIKNIKTLVQVRETNVNKVCGADMKVLPCLENAWLAIDNGLIADLGKMEDFPGITDWKDLEVIDASGKIVMPCYADSHTHIVYSGNRESEFVDRINGLSYEEIAKIIDIPIGTVRSRLHRARNLMKEKLRDYAKKMGYHENR